MTQIERLLMLLDALPQRRQATTVKQLYDTHTWGVDLRTLQRDLKLLDDLGLAERCAVIKDDLEDSKSERWCAVARTSPYRARLNTEQAIALALLERVAKRLLPASVVKALHREFADAQRHLRIQRHVDPRTQWTDKVEVLPEGFSPAPRNTDPQVLQRLQRALLANRQVLARYRAQARGRGTKRTLEPRALVQRGPFLYVIATRPDKAGSEPHWYALHRFVSVRILKRLSRPSHFRLQAYLANGGAEFGATGAPIALKAWVCKELKRTLKEAPLAPDMKLRPARGGAIMTATVPRSWPFQRWLLSRGPDIEVLEPKDLRAYMKGKLHAAAAPY